MRSNSMQYYGNYRNGGGMGRAITGLLIGGAIGAAIGFLLAPMSGEELRHTIREEINDAQKKAMGVVEDAQDKGRELKDKGREVVEGIKEDVSNIGDNIKDTA